MENILLWLLEFAVLWLSAGVFIVATSWYAATIIERRWPDWWRQHIVGDAPNLGPPFRS